MRPYDGGRREFRTGPLPRADMGVMTISTTITTSASVTTYPVGVAPPNGSAGLNTIWQVYFLYNTNSPGSDGENYNRWTFKVGDNVSSGDSIAVIDTSANPAAGEAVKGPVDFEDRVLYAPTPGKTLYASLSLVGTGGDNHAGDLVTLGFHFIIQRMA